MKNEFWNFDRAVNSRPADICVGREEVKYRKGFRSEWETAPVEMIMPAGENNCPPDLARLVGKNYSRIKMVEDGAPVHVFIDGTYHGTLMRVAERMTLPRREQTQVQQRQRKDYSSGGNPPPPTAQRRMTMGGEPLLE